MAPGGLPLPFPVATAGAAAAGPGRVDGWSEATSRLSRRVRRKCRPHQSSRNSPAAMVSTRPTPDTAVERTLNWPLAIRTALSGVVMVASSLNAPEARASTGTSTRVGTLGGSVTRSITAPFGKSSLSLLSAMRTCTG